MQKHNQQQGYLVNMLGRLKGLTLSHLYRAGVALVAYSGVLPRRWAQRSVKAFWEQSANSIHQRYGRGTSDFATLADILRRYRPRSVLDVGCGSGRLFGVYRDCGIAKVTGMDIAAQALEIAQRDFPQARLLQGRLEDLASPAIPFDLGICNRVLQHVPNASIEQAVARLTTACRLVYVNELTGSDQVDEVFFMRKYDYRQLFARMGRMCLESGCIGNQTYFVFGPGPEIKE